jgi:hypothetical protein
VAENTTFVTALTSTDVDAVGINPAQFSITGGADADLFDIVDNDLVFKTAKDFETDSHSYQVEISAFDGVNTTAKTITVSITDVNEAPNSFQRLGSEFLVNTSTQNTQSYPTITALTNGGFVVSWRDESGLDGASIKAQVFDATGSKVGGEVLVNTLNGQDLWRQPDIWLWWPECQRRRTQRDLVREQRQHDRAGRRERQCQCRSHHHAHGH